MAIKSDRFREINKNIIEKEREVLEEINGKAKANRNFDMQEDQTISKGRVRGIGESMK